MNLTDEHDHKVTELRERMDAFYASTADYSAFRQPSESPEEWAYVKEAIVETVRKNGECRLLEFGAGRSGFADSLGELRKSVRLTLHDVTPANAEYLRLQADEVRIGKLDEVSGQFDVVFSTFVFEHVSDPRRTLEFLLRLLVPGGVLLLFCPRYDMPFYLSHSADHYGLWKRLRMGAAVCWKRLETLVTGRPAFLIHADPAVLHIDWKRDRDAIHWASLFDLEAFFRNRGEIRKLAIRSGTLKDWCVKNLLRINIRFTVHEGPCAQTT